MQNKNMELDKLIFILKKQAKFTVRFKNKAGDEKEYFNVNVALEHNKLTFFGWADLDINKCEFDFAGEGRLLFTVYPKDSDYVYIKVYK